MTFYSFLHYIHQRILPRIMTFQDFTTIPRLPISDPLTCQAILAGSTYPAVRHEVHMMTTLLFVCSNSCCYCNIPYIV